jgi:hypothetical protein
MTRLPSGVIVMARTPPSTRGRQDSRAPAADTAASRDLACPPTAENRPPRKTVLPETAMAPTRPFTAGAKAELSPPPGRSKAATPRRALPSTVVKSPPA